MQPPVTNRIDQLIGSRVVALTRLPVRPATEAEERQTLQGVRLQIALSSHVLSAFVSKTR